MRRVGMLRACSKSHSSAPSSLAPAQDLLIPSAEEGPRLQKALPRAQLRVERGRSHALLQEGGVDLAALLAAEGFYVQVRRRGRGVCTAGVVLSPRSRPLSVELPSTPAHVHKASY